MSSVEPATTTTVVPPDPTTAAAAAADRFFDRRRAAGTAAAVAVGAVALRLALSAQKLKPDESGYLLVARGAHPGGPFLYGDLWVDRPPLLIAAYAAADAMGGLGALRAIAVVGVVALVVAAAASGWTIAGLRGSRCAAVVAAGLACTPLFAAPEVDGEVLAVPLVMAAVAIGLHAQLSPSARWRPALLVLAGFIGSCAVFVKQNFIDALVMLAVLLLLRVVARQVPAARAAGHLLAMATGAVVPAAAAVAWAASWHGGLAGGVRALWGPLVAFRSASLDVITDQSLTAPLTRAVELFWFALASGLFGLLVVFVLVSLTQLRRLDPVPTAVVAMVLAGQPAIALGGSFWSHYLIQLIPAAALAVAVMAGRPGLVRTGGAALTAFVAASALVAVPLRIPGTLATGCQNGAGTDTVGRYVGRASRPGDTIAVVYASATIVERSGLPTVYPYLWSLPLRALDPDVSALRATLTGPDAATWVVETLPLDSWQLDASGRLSVTLVSNYRPVAHVCGRSILLRDDVDRTLPPMPQQG